MMGNINFLGSEPLFERQHEVLVLQVTDITHQRQLVVVFSWT